MNLKSIKRYLRRIGILPDYVNFKGSCIPTPDKRWCGPEFSDDKYYLQSAEYEAHRLVEKFGCNLHSRILDIGCGQGRLAIGLTRILGGLNYIGLDVDDWSIKWCKKHISEDHPTYDFQRINVYNKRYNRSASAQVGEHKFNIDNGTIDIVFLYSVFSHMEDADMRAYLREIRRVLTIDGGLFFTTFIEENVEDVTINPKGYIFESNSGALHVVRYCKNYLFDVLRSSGFEVFEFSYATEADTQSAIYARPQISR